MENYGRQILSEYSGQKIIIEILKVIWKKVCLNKSEQIMKLVGEVEMEVNSGGFEQYMFYTSGQNPAAAVDALKLIGAGYTASLLEKAIIVYGNAPTSQYYDPMLHDDLSEQRDQHLEYLDHLFFEYRDNLEELQIAFINANIADF